MSFLIRRGTIPQVARQGALAALDNGILALFGLFYTLYLARTMPRDDYGAVVLFDLLRNFGGIFIAAVGQAVVKHIAEQPAVRNAVVISSFILQSIYWLGLSLVVLALRAGLAQWFSAPTLADLLIWLPVILGLLIVHTMASRVCWGLGEFQWVLGLDLIFTGIFVGITWSFSRSGMVLTAPLVIKLYVIARSFSAVAALAILARRIRLTAPNRVWVLTLWRFARALTMNSLAVFGLSRADLVVVGILLTPVAVAAYNAGSVVFNAFMLISETMNMLLLPKISIIHRRADTDVRGAARRLYIVYSLVFVTLSLPLVGVLLIFPNQLSSLLYGDRYPEVPSLLMIFAVWGVALPFARVGASILNGLNRPHVNVYFAWVLAVVNILLDWVLAINFGIYGVAVGTLAVMAISVGCYWGAMYHYIGLRISDVIGWRNSIIGEVTQEREIA